MAGCPRWITTCCCGALLLATVPGCGGEVVAKITVVPPDPVEQPVEPADADGDGIADDGTDRCPGEKEDGLEPEPKDGCQAKDPDGDGVIGSRDKCPQEPETKNEYQDDDGCPDEVPSVYATDTEIVFRGEISFGFAGGSIASAADALIKDIAAVLAQHPDIELVEVAAHTSGTGSEADVRATRSKAGVVVAALEKLGVAGQRLRAVGYGSYCPIEGGKSRRIEIKIVRRAGQDTGAELGCDKAREKSLGPK